MIFQFDKSGKLKVPTPEDTAAADADSYVVVLNQGVMREDSKPYWAYVAVKPSKYDEFMGATAEQRPIRLKDYGAILKYGFGKDVPASIKEEMKRNHGCDENYVSALAQNVKEAQKEFLKQQEDMRIGDIVAMLKQKQG